VASDSWFIALLTTEFFSNPHPANSHLLLSDNLTLLLPLFVYPLNNWLFASLLPPAFLTLSAAFLVVVVLIIAASKVYSWYLSAHSYKEQWQQSSSVQGEQHTQLTALTNANAQLRAHVAALQNTWDFTADYLAKGGAVLALTTIAQQPSSAHLFPEDSGPHQGSEDDIFFPVPAPPPPRDVNTPVEQVPVVVLTSAVSDAAIDSFHIIVVQPADVGAEAALLQEVPPAVAAHIEVTILRDSLQEDQRQYYFRIEPGAIISRGANSIAMEWLIKRAERKGVQKIWGVLTQSITDEGHRARLHHFYLRKHGFLSTSVDQETHLTKKLTGPKQSNQVNVHRA
jgi:hypothetical protein